LNLFSKESREPAFLQRLRAQSAGNFTDRPAPRPRKQRNPEDDEEDEPIYVTDDGQVISSKEFKQMNEGNEQDDDNNHEINKNIANKDGLQHTSDTNDDVTQSSKELNGSSKKMDSKLKESAVAELGNKRMKRKAIKIGNDDDEDKQEEDNGSGSGSVQLGNEKEDDTTITGSGPSTGAKGTSIKPDVKKVKKTPKSSKQKVKLSFGQEED